MVSRALFFFCVTLCHEGPHSVLAKRLVSSRNDVGFFRQKRTGALALIIFFCHSRCVFLQCEMQPSIRSVLLSRIFVRRGAWSFRQRVFFGPLAFCWKCLKWSLSERIALSKRRCAQPSTVRCAACAYSFAQSERFV